MSSMPPNDSRPEWYYVGHYGQLGPLTQVQILELIEGGVIERQTYVWKAGMTDWVPAATLPGFMSSFTTADQFAPPPSPMKGPTPGFAPGGMAPPQPQYENMPPSAAMMPAAYNPYMRNMYQAPLSDKSKVVGGVLNIIIPGVGRMYLGYSAIGVMQFILTFVCGVGAIWAFIDGILILANGVQYDGYGRQLR